MHASIDTVKTHFVLSQEHVTSIRREADLWMETSSHLAQVFTARVSGNILLGQCRYYRNTLLVGIIVGTQFFHLAYCMDRKHMYNYMSYITQDVAQLRFDTGYRKNLIGWTSYTPEQISALGNRLIHSFGKQSMYLADYVRIPSSRILELSQVH